MPRNAAQNQPGSPDLTGSISTLFQRFNPPKDLENSHRKQDQDSHCKNLHHRPKPAKLVIK